MADSELVPAAQYLRKSTEHQKYSLDNQAAHIGKYAISKGFEIIKTYSDAKTGVILRRRKGLRQLLQDVVADDCPYKAVLVYDISRWGRFQDADESAHYEFVCKSAGAPVHYCAETFSNDGSTSSIVMKALKRTMAAEYSRELGVKVLGGQKRLARMGFKQGGLAGYGLRRLLVTEDRKPKEILQFGARKYLTTDRVILVPGPDEEVVTVREIFRMLVDENRIVNQIARELNRRGIRRVGGKEWDYQSVYTILSRHKYTGCHVFNRTTCKLYTSVVKQPQSEWIITPGAFEPIVSQPIFDKAQEILKTRTIRLSDEECLQKLRDLLKEKGKITHGILKKSTNTPSCNTYRYRFGGLMKAFELIGYKRMDLDKVAQRQRGHLLREKLARDIAAQSAGDISIIRPNGRWRCKLRLKNGVEVAVIVARIYRVWKETLRWMADPCPREKNLITLFVRFGKGNQSYFDFHIFPRIGKTGRFVVTKSFMKKGVRVSHLSELASVIEKVDRSMK